MKINDLMLAQLFLQLAQMEEAGIPILQAFDLLKQEATPWASVLTPIHRRLKAGQTLAESGYRAGIFNPTLKALIHAGETSGELATIYRQLAQYYEAKNRRQRKMQSQLYLPAAVLVIGLFVQPLPWLVSGEITVGIYLQQTVGVLLVLVMLVWLSIRLPFWLTDGFLKSLKTPFHAVQLQTPLVADWLSERQRNEFLRVLAMLLEAGVDFAQALPIAVASIKNTVLQQRFAPSLKNLASGESVKEHLEKTSLFTPSTLQIIHTSEQSGKLASGILRLTHLESERLNLQDDLLAQWIPRLFYSLIAIWVGYSMISHSAMMLPKMPVV